MTATKTAILLVHGAWHGAWCWEDQFAPYLRTQGHVVHTLDLPSHGRAGPEKIPNHRIADYVDCVAERIDQLNTPTVVLGHSMGGYVVQKLMERKPPQLAGAILFAAATQRGVWGVVGHLLRHQPLDFLTANLQRSLYHLARSPERAQALFHRDSLPTAVVEQHWSRINNESYLAFLDMLLLAPIDPQKAPENLPKLFIGGEADVIFPPAIVQRNAAEYGAPSRIYADMPHALQQDENWQEVADDISSWVHHLAKDS